MVDRNIICLFPVFWLKVDNLPNSAKANNFLHEIICLQESTQRPQKFNVCPEFRGLLTQEISTFHRVHPSFLCFCVFFIPFPVRPDRSDEELNGWQVVLTLQRLRVHFPLGSEMCALLALPGNFGMRANAKWQITTLQKPLWTNRVTEDVRITSDLFPLWSLNDAACTQNVFMIHHVCDLKVQFIVFSVPKHKHNDHLQAPVVDQNQ